MFTSQTARDSRFSHLATAAALLFTIAVGVMQASQYAPVVSAGSVSVTVR